MYVLFLYYTLLVVHHVQNKLLRSKRPRFTFLPICSWYCTKSWTDPISSLALSHSHSWQSHTNPRMLLSLVQSTITSSLPFQSSSNSKTLSVLPKSLFLGLGIEPTNDLQRLLLFSNPRHPRKPSLSIHASLIEAPVLWAGRLCIFYALLRTGLAGSQANPLVSGLLS